MPQPIPLIIKFLAAGVLLAWLPQCAGYRLGVNKPTELAAVHTLHIPPFTNESIFPRASPVLTNSIIDEITVDGTYRLADSGSADATVRGRIVGIQYNPARFARLDALRPVELNMTMQVAYDVIDNETGITLTSGTFSSRTNLFVGENIQTARASGLADVSRRAAVAFVSRLAHGF